MRPNNCWPYLFQGFLFFHLFLLGLLDDAVKVVIDGHVHFFPRVRPLRDGKVLLAEVHVRDLVVAEEDAAGFTPDEAFAFLFRRMGIGVMAVGLFRQSAVFRVLAGEEVVGEVVHVLFPLLLIVRGGELFRRECGGRDEEGVFLQVVHGKRG